MVTRYTRVEVDVDGPVPLLVVVVGEQVEAGAARDAGVVDEHVDGAERLSDLAREPRRGPPLREVALDEQTTRRPSAAISSCCDGSSSTRARWTATSAPARASSSAMPRPIPFLRPAPVTSAIRPSRLPMAANLPLGGARAGPGARRFLEGSTGTVSMTAEGRLGIVEDRLSRRDERRRRASGSPVPGFRAKRGCAPLDTCTRMRWPRRKRCAVGQSAKRTAHAVRVAPAAGVDALEPSQTFARRRAGRRRRGARNVEVLEGRAHEDLRARPARSPRRRARAARSCRRGRRRGLDRALVAARAGGEQRTAHRRRRVGGVVAVGVGGRRGRRRAREPPARVEMRSPPARARRRPVASRATRPRPRRGGARAGPQQAPSPRRCARRRRGTRGAAAPTPGRGVRPRPDQEPGAGPRRAARGSRRAARQEEVVQPASAHGRRDVADALAWSRAAQYGSSAPSARAPRPKIALDSVSARVARRAAGRRRAAQLGEPAEHAQPGERRSCRHHRSTTRVEREPPA